MKIEYPDLYNAALNALDEEGVDYANGGCFWDGDDLKTDGAKHKHYKWGYLFTDFSHDIHKVSNTPPKNITTDFGHFDYTIESTAAYGHTVFWKYTDEYLSATRGKPCR